MALYGASANTCPLVAEVMGAALNNGAFMVVKADSNGKMVLCGAGELAYGVLIAETPETLAIDDEVTVQVDSIAPVRCGGTIAKGAAVAADANGKIVAASGDAKVLGIALEAGASGKLIRVKLA